MTILDACKWLEATQIGTTIVESSWMFPTIETLHVLALTLVVGSIAMLDLRLLGVANRGMGVMQLTAQTLPWTWGAFVLAATTGSLMFTSAAVKYYNNTSFRVKMLLLLLAGLNMIVFNLTASRGASAWDLRLPTPRAARVAAALSLAFWIGVVIAGRWVGFTTDQFSAS